MDVIESSLSWTAEAKEEIYRLIRDLTDRGVGILLITDELLELIGLSDRILVMQRGRVVTEVPAPPDAKPTERELVAWMLPRSGNTPDFILHQALETLQ